MGWFAFQIVAIFASLPNSIFPVFVRYILRLGHWLLNSQVDASFFLLVKSRFPHSFTHCFSCNFTHSYTHILCIRTTCAWSLLFSFSLIHSFFISTKTAQLCSLAQPYGIIICTRARSSYTCPDAYHTQYLTHSLFLFQLLVARYARSYIFLPFRSDHDSITPLLH